MDNNSVPYIAFEAEMSRHERIIKRLIGMLIVVIVLLFASNVGWLLFFNSFEIQTSEVSLESEDNGIANYIVASNANTQRILDQMCSDKIDAKNAEIMALERQLAMANLQASQVAQTAEIISKLPATTTA